MIKSSSGGKILSSKISPDMVENTKRYPRMIPRSNGKGTGFQTMPMVLGDIGVPTMSWGGRSGSRNKWHEGWKG